MAATLKQLLARPDDQPPIGTITGEPGVGKTSLAVKFPKAVYLPFEDGLEAIPKAQRPYAFPRCTTMQQGIDYLDQLLREEHPFRTVVIDSVTELGTIIEQEIIASDVRKPKSINTAFGGYGAGLNAAAARHKIFANKARELRTKRGMAVIFVAHSRVETIEPPDGADPFTRYTLRLDQRAIAPYVDPADFVAFVRLHTKFVTKEESKRTRAIADKARVIVLHPTGAHVSKNRYGIEEPVTWNNKLKNPLLELIPYYATRIAAARAKKQ